MKTQQVSKKIVHRAQVAKEQLKKKARATVTGDENKHISDMLKEPVRLGNERVGQQPGWTDGLS